MNVHVCLNQPSRKMDWIEHAKLHHVQSICSIAGEKRLACLPDKTLILLLIGNGVFLSIFRGFVWCSHLKLHTQKNSLLLRRNMGLSTIVGLRMNTYIFILKTCKTNSPYLCNWFAIVSVVHHDTGAILIIRSTDQQLAHPTPRPARWTRQ